MLGNGNPNGNPIHIPIHSINTNPNPLEIFKISKLRSVGYKSASLLPSQPSRASLLASHSPYAMASQGPNLRSLRARSVLLGRYRSERSEVQRLQFSLNELQLSLSRLRCPPALPHAHADLAALGSDTASFDAQLLVQGEAQKLQAQIGM